MTALRRPHVVMLNLTMRNVRFQFILAQNHYDVTNLFSAGGSGLTS